MDPSIPPELPLAELARRIADQKAELEALHKAYESTQTRLATLIMRRQQMQQDLKQLNIEIETMLGGAGTPLQMPSREAANGHTPPPLPPNGNQRPAAVQPAAAAPVHQEKDEKAANEKNPSPRPPAGAHPPTSARRDNHHANHVAPPAAEAPTIGPVASRPLGAGWRITDNLDFQFESEDAGEDHGANGSTGVNGVPAKRPSPAKGTETGH